MQFLHLFFNMRTYFRLKIVKIPRKGSIEGVWYQTNMVVVAKWAFGNQPGELFQFLEIMSVSSWQIYLYASDKKVIELHQWLKNRSKIFWQKRQWDFPVADNMAASFWQTSRCASQVTSIHVVEFLTNKLVSFSSVWQICRWVPGKHVRMLLANKPVRFSSDWKTCRWASGKHIDELLLWQSNIFLCFWQPNRWASPVSGKCVYALLANRSLSFCSVWQTCWVSDKQVGGSQICLWFSNKRVDELLQWMTNISVRFWQKHLVIFSSDWRKSQLASSKQVDELFQWLANMPSRFWKTSRHLCPVSYKHVNELRRNKLLSFSSRWQTCQWASGKKVGEHLKWLGNMSVIFCQTRWWTSLLTVNDFSEFLATKLVSFSIGFKIWRWASSKKVAGILQWLAKMRMSFWQTSRWDSPVSGKHVGEFLQWLADM